MSLHACPIMTAGAAVTVCLSSKRACKLAINFLFFIYWLPGQFVLLCEATMQLCPVSGIRSAVSVPDIR